MSSIKRTSATAAVIAILAVALTGCSANSPQSTVESWLKGDSNVCAAGSPPPITDARVTSVDEDGDGRWKVNVEGQGMGGSASGTVTVEDQDGKLCIIATS